MQVVCQLCDDVASLDRRIMSLSNANQERFTQGGEVYVGSVGFKYEHNDPNPLQRDTMSPVAATLTQNVEE